MINLSKFDIIQITIQPLGGIIMKSKKNYIPETIIFITVLSILISLILIYLIDLNNIAGLRDYMFSLNPGYFFFEFRPFVFHNWYRNGGLAEIMQWLLLGGSAFFAALMAGKDNNTTRKEKMFWGIMGIVFILMLIEDAGDPRHTIRSYVQAFFSEVVQGPMGSLTELIYFSILAVIPLYALIRYGKTLKQVPRSLYYTFSGFVFYAVATILSFLGSAIDLYHRAGGVLYDFMIKLGDDALAQIWQNYNLRERWDFIEFFLMDSLVEEVLELLGAAAFLAAVLAFLLDKYYLSEKSELNN